MKAITIAGRLTRDAEQRNTPKGDSVTSFAVAVDDRSSGEKSTIFFDCALWGKRGEALGQYLKKGASVCVSGDLGKREHEGKTYLQVRVESVTLLGGKTEGDFRSNDASGVSGRGGGGGHPQSGRGSNSASSYDLNDDIPF
jgi:single-strand DNA-binding protein